MRVSKDDVICGVPAPTARQLMRAYFDDHSAAVACEVLGLDHDAARDQLRAFEAAGYIRQVERGTAVGGERWVTTVQGNALAQASFGKPISRATATRHLAQVIERARSYNADPGHLLSVSAWMTAAARRELRLRDGLAAVAEWEAEHGALAGEELAAARRRVSLGRGERRSA